MRTRIVAGWAALLLVACGTQRSEAPAVSEPTAPIAATEPVGATSSYDAANDPRIACASDADCVVFAGPCDQWIAAHSGHEEEYARDIQSEVDGWMGCPVGAPGLGPRPGVACVEHTCQTTE